MKCSCGGQLKSAVLSEFDFSAFAGVPVKLRDVPGLRCDACGAETLPGSVIDSALHVFALELVKSPTRLPREAARYLRRYLGFTQKELAERMGITRETVAVWESGTKAISPQHDFILRSLAGNHVIAAARQVGMAEEVAASLGAVRMSAPPARRKASMVLDHMGDRLLAQVGPDAA